MAVIKVVSSKASIGKAVNYVSKDEKTKDGESERKLVSGKDCSPSTAIDEMMATKEQWNKTGGRQYKHYIQSFDPDENLMPSKAHNIGKEWAEKNFKGHEVVIATHVDKGHVHNHFIVNTVNFENGKKFQQSKKDLENLKKHSDKICEREGLKVITEPSKSITSFDQKKYKAIEKGFSGKEKSYLVETAKDVSQSLKTATSRETFVKNMENKGYKVNWTDKRKHITFTNSDGKSVRNTNLEKTFKEQKFSKEGMENEIQRNRGKGNTVTPRTDGNAQNIDWTAVRNNVQSEGNRVPKQPGHDVTGTIQRKVRDVKDRTQQAIGGVDKGAEKSISNDQRENQSAPGVKQSSEQQHGDPVKTDKPKVRERDFDMER